MEQSMWNTINKWIVKIDDLVWGVPLMVLIMLGGLLLSLRTKGIQIRRLPHIGAVIRVPAVDVIAEAAKRLCRVNPVGVIFGALTGEIGGILYRLSPKNAADVVGFFGLIGNTDKHQKSKPQQQCDCKRKIFPHPCHPCFSFARSSFCIRFSAARNCCLCASEKIHKNTLRGNSR